MVICFGDYIVPEQTARVAYAAFQQSSLCIRLYDQQGPMAEVLCLEESPTVSALLRAHGFLTKALYV
jgi:hypothetical protein